MSEAVTTQAPADQTEQLDQVMEEDQTQSSEETKKREALAKGEELAAAARARPFEYKAWTEWITWAEAQNDIEKTRQVYNEFLAEYPLCFGYWKKFAEHENRNGEFQKAVEVFERGVAADGHDFHIWEQYARSLSAKGEDTETMRSIFTRAIAAVGDDHNSGGLWDMFIDFEKTHGNVRSVTGVYKQVLEQPVADANRYLQQFKDWVHGHALEEFITAEELEAIVIPNPPAPQQPQQPPPPPSSPTEDPTSVASPSSTTPAAEKEAPLSEPEQKKQIWLQEIESKTAFVREFVAERVQFESKLKCSYFDFKALDETQLSTWRRYLEFEESVNGPWPKRVTRLYERCLIPCANYVEFWLRYAHHLEKTSPQNALALLNRASKTFLKRNPDIFIAIASLQESLGDVEAARQAFDHAQSLQPTLARTYIERANLERRHNHPAGYFACIATLSAGITLTASDPQAVMLLRVTSAKCHLAQSRKSGLSETQRATARQQALDDLEKAVELLPSGIEAWRELLAVHCEIGGPCDKATKEVFERACVQADLDDASRFGLWVYYLDQVESSCESVQVLRELEYRFLTLYPNGQGSGSGTQTHTSTSSKRPREDSTATESAKKAKTVAAATDEAAAAAAAAAAMAQYQAAYGAYGAAAYTAPVASVASPTSAAAAYAPAVADPAAAYAAYSGYGYGYPSAYGYYPQYYPQQ